MKQVMKDMLTHGVKINHLYYNRWSNLIFALYTCILICKDNKQLYILKMIQTNSDIM